MITKIPNSKLVTFATVGTWTGTNYCRIVLDTNTPRTGKTLVLVDANIVISIENYSTSLKDNRVVLVHSLSRSLLISEQ